MPFDPEFLIPIVFFTFLFLIFSRMIKNRHELKKLEAMKGQGDGDRSLTTSELQMMIDEAVHQATADLQERLEMVERPRLEAPSEGSDISKTLGRERAH